jgi:beta-phosphoglucomutase family hydrolase
MTAARPALSPAEGAVLWDLDGVLVDSTRFHYEAYRKLLAECGREIGFDEFRNLIGLRNEAILRRLLGELPPAEVERLAQRKEELFRELIAGKVEALPGAAGLVRRLHEGGVPMAIVSSTPRANIELILGSLGLAEAFAVVVGAEDARRGKPHPEGFLAAAERLGVPPGDCVVLEDAPEGIEGAKAAGMRCIGVATTRPPERLSEADLVVERLDDPRVEAFLLAGG